MKGAKDVRVADVTTNGAVVVALGLYGAPDLDIILRRKVPSSFILQNVRGGDIAPSNDRASCMHFPRQGGAYWQHAR